MNIIMLTVVVSVVFLAITAAIARSRAGGVALLGVVAATCLLFYRNRESPRAQSPVEVVADRLAFEANSIVQEAALPLKSHDEEHSGRVGNWGSSTLRHHMLRRLHQRQTSDFVAANGFGLSRWISLEVWNLLTNDEPTPLPPQPEPPYVFDGSPDRSTEATAGQYLHLLNLGRPEKGDLFSLFSTNQDDFHEPEPIGYVEDLNRVVGFKSQPKPVADFQLVRLELVSLLKHEVPVAYVSEHLPQMDELKDAPTRSLTDFERRALDRLRSQGDLVIDDTPNRIRMVGSLRAGKDCMECHSVRRGELLGAFSYELVSPIPVRVEPGA